MALDSKGSALKVGDFIEVHGRSLWNYTCERAAVVDLGKDRIEYRPIGKHDYLTNLCASVDCTLIPLIPSFMSSLIERASAAFKSEPEKSFIKAGVTNADDTFTTEGREVFLAFLLKKYGADFKKEVIDPILAEEKKGKS